MANKKHSIVITMTQSTDGEEDNQTLVHEYSDESAIHVIKTKVFSAELLKAINSATDQLTDMALDQMGVKKRD